MLLAFQPTSKQNLHVIFEPNGSVNLTLAVLYLGFCIPFLHFTENVLLRLYLGVVNVSDSLPLFLFL